MTIASTPFDINTPSGWRMVTRAVVMELKTPHAIWGFVRVTVQHVKCRSSSQIDQQHTNNVLSCWSLTTIEGASFDISTAPRFLVLTVTLHTLDIQHMSLVSSASLARWCTGHALSSISQYSCFCQSWKEDWGSSIWCHSCTRMENSQPNSCNGLWTALIGLRYNIRCQNGNQGLSIVPRCWRVSVRWCGFTCNEHHYSKA